MSPIADRPLAALLDDLAAAGGPGAAGVAAATTCAQAAALVELTAGLARRRCDGEAAARMQEIAAGSATTRAWACDALDRDVAAYGAVLGATDPEARARGLIAAAAVPDGIARAADSVAVAASEVARSPAATDAAWRTDALAAEVLARAAGEIGRLLATANRDAAVRP